jgi:predicted Fe-Mo cluster-binding NifX family protein
MKIAVITDDGVTVSRHFGRALHYLVLTIENNQVASSELRAKPGHDHFKDGDHAHIEGTGQRHGYGQEAVQRHTLMAEVISDCQILVCRGMGMGAYESMRAIGIRTIVTDLESIDKAISAVLDGSIVDHKERLH